MEPTCVDRGTVPVQGSLTSMIPVAAEVRLSKLQLADLLPIGKRQAFLVACAGLEKRYTDDCAAKNDPCLESGCAAEGEVCLEPLLRAESDYAKECRVLWTEFRK
jgi:hypothetical protein